MKKHLHAMLEALIDDNTEEANKQLHAYLTSKTRKLMLGEKDDDDSDDEGKDEEKDKDNGDEEKDKDNGDSDHDDDDDDDDKKGKKKVKESLAHAKGHADDKEGEYKKYRHNEKGEVYHKVPHKDDSEGYGHDKSRKMSKKLKAESDSGAHEKKGDAYKDKPHKDNSRGAKSEDKGKKGLGTAGGPNTSPDTDGKKDNRRTDKTAKYHGTDRGGKDVSSK